MNDHIPSLYCCLPTHDQSVGSILREMPTSTAAAPPQPTWLLCTHTHTHTHSTAEMGWNKRDQVLLTATITPLEKKALIVFVWRGGGGLLSSDKDRSMERTGCSFWIKQTKHFLGFLHYYPSIPLSLQSNRTIWTRVLVCNISWLQIIEELTVKWQFSSKYDWFQSLTSACF